MAGTPASNVESTVKSTVESAGLRLSVRERSPAGRGRPTVVLVHGYPDRQEAWDALVGRLPLDRWHVVTYDVRGAGASQAPSDRAGYRVERLVDDLVAVLDHVLSPGEPAHLVGHDWGSVQLWEALAHEPVDDRLRGRIASFTSVSGPPPDHFARLARHPKGRALELARQLGHSWYVLFFQTPLLPDEVWRRAHRTIGRLTARAEGLPDDHWGPGLASDAVHGLELYRANLRRPRREPRPRPRTDVPVLVVHPLQDRFLTGVLLEGLGERCSDLRVETVDAGHWMTVTHPETLAGLLVEHVDGH